MAIRILTSKYDLIRKNKQLQKIEKLVDHDLHNSENPKYNDKIPTEWSDPLNNSKELLSEVQKSSILFLNVVIKLRHLHSEHVLERFGKDYDKEEEQIEILTLDIKNLFKKISTEINSLSSEENTQEDQFKKSIKLSIFNEVNELATQFREDQKNYIQSTLFFYFLELKIVKQRKKKLGNTYHDESEDPDLRKKMEKLEQQIYEKGLTDEQIRQILDNQRQILQRDQELEGILRSIIELQDMFKEFNQLVVQQGTLLDRIDVNIETTSYNVKEAVTHLTVAEGAQKASRFILILILFGKFFI
jgi:syntaxin 16